MRQVSSNALRVPPSLIRRVDHGLDPMHSALTAPTAVAAAWCCSSTCLGDREMRPDGSNVKFYVEAKSDQAPSCEPWHPGCGDGQRSQAAAHVRRLPRKLRTGAAHWGYKAVSKRLLFPSPQQLYLLVSPTGSLDCRARSLLPWVRGRDSVAVEGRWRSARGRITLLCSLWSAEVALWAPSD
jgi:hypothetical protein